MNEVHDENGYGLVIFKPGTPHGTKVKSIIFFIILCIIILAQACYWLFANSAEPIVLGMPYGMFFVVLLIFIEFIALVALYFSDNNSEPGEGGAK